jgi:hypothetical protein
LSCIPLNGAVARHGALVHATCGSRRREARSRRTPTHPCPRAGRRSIAPPARMAPYWRQSGAEWCRWTGGWLRGDGRKAIRDNRLRRGHERAGSGGCTTDPELSAEWCRWTCGRLQSESHKALGHNGLRFLNERPRAHGLHQIAIQRGALPKLPAGGVISLARFTGLSPRSGLRSGVDAG